MTSPRNLITRPLESADLFLEEKPKDQYSGEIGVPTKIALVVKSVRAKIILQVTTPIVIGRLDTDTEPESFIDLNPFGAEDSGVSRRHLRLWPENSQLFIEDLSSTNGTYFNGIRMMKNTAQRIHHGDQITLGRLELEIEVIIDLVG